MRFVRSRVCDGGDCAKYCCVLRCDVVLFGRTFDDVFGVTGCPRLQVGRVFGYHAIQRLYKHFRCVQNVVRFDGARVGVM
jgi:hypothetical protein